QRSPLSSFPHPPTTAIYPLSLHDALPISQRHAIGVVVAAVAITVGFDELPAVGERDRQDVADTARRAIDELLLVQHLHAVDGARSEEHTSEFQSRSDLVCRLLLEKKKNKK